MKKIYILLAFLSFSAFLSAQESLIPGPKLSIPGVIPTTKTPTDTIKPNGITNSTGYTIYSYLSGSVNVGYVFGTNNQTKAQAEVFPLNQSYYVDEVLLWCARKDIIGTSGNLTCTVNFANGTGLASTGNVTTAPGTQLATTSIGSTDIDTSGYLTVIPFLTPVYVNSNYAVVLDYTTYVDDSLAIVSCMAGDPGNVEASWMKLNNNSWRTIKKTFNANIDMYMLVATDQSTAGIDSPDYFGGMKFSSYPNPCVNSVNIVYDLEKTARFSMKIFDSHGKTVMDIPEFEQIAGKYTVPFNTEKLSNGNYYISLSANGQHLTKKLVVCK